jgi:hypothetical protein
VSILPGKRLGPHEILSLPLVLEEWARCIAPETLV